MQLLPCCPQHALFFCVCCTTWQATPSDFIITLTLPLLLLLLRQATPSDFIITGSADGHLKFWKKQEQGIEFVKHYRSHIGAVDGEQQPRQQQQVEGASVQQLNEAAKGRQKQQLKRSGGWAAAGAKQPQ